MQLKICTMLVLGMVLTSCGKSHSDGFKTMNVPGEDPSYGLLPGQGFNPVDGTIKGNCLKLGEFKTQSGNSTGQTAEFRLLEIGSETALRENLNVSASASFGGIVGRGSARASFAQSVNKTNQSRYLMVHVRVSNQLEISSSFTYSQTAQNLLRKGDSMAFLRQCGSEFVYGRRTGGEFFGVFEFTFASTEEDRAFSAAISGSGATWKGSASVNSELSKFGKFATTQVKMYKVGGTSGLPEVNSISDFALKFDSMVSNAQNGSVTLELLTKGYDGVEPLDLQPNTQLLVRQRYVIEQLGRSRDNARELLNSIRFVKTNPSLYQLDQSLHLDEAETVLTSYLNTMNDAAVDCFEDVFKGCKIPTVAFHSVSLPARRKTPACEEIKVPVCVLPAENGECLAYNFDIKIVCD